MSGGFLNIVGAGDHGVVVAEAASLSGWRYIKFYDDFRPGGTWVGSWVVEGDTEKLWLDNAASNIHVAIGNNHARQIIFSRAKDLGKQLSSVIHPSSVQSSSARVGAGAFIGAQANVGASAIVGEGVILNTGCSLDHHCQLSDFVHVAPGVTLAGRVSVGERTFIGTGASVRNSVRIGDDVTVGLGAAVVGDLDSGGTFFGVPAKKATVRN